MTTRKQAQLSRLLKEAIYDAIHNRLNDPRIEGFISITKVELSSNLREANIFFSIFGSSEVSARKTFTAIEHAKSRIRSLVAKNVRRRFCPTLHFYIDEHFKKTIETVNIIDETSSELKDKSEINEQ